ncbi:unnamed protein product [Parajaminaea phylloscopi]
MPSPTPTKGSSAHRVLSHFNTATQRRTQSEATRHDKRRLSTPSLLLTKLNEAKQLFEHAPEVMLPTRAIGSSSERTRRGLETSTGAQWAMAKSTRRQRKPKTVEAPVVRALSGTRETQVLHIVPHSPQQDRRLTAWLFSAGLLASESDERTEQLRSLRNLVPAKPPYNKLLDVKSGARFFLLPAGLDQLIGQVLQALQQQEVLSAGALSWSWDLSGGCDLAEAAAGVITTGSDPVLRLPMWTYEVFLVPREAPAEGRFLSLVTIRSDDGTEAEHRALEGREERDGAAVVGPEHDGKQPLQFEGGWSYRADLFLDPAPVVVQAVLNAHRREQQKERPPAWRERFRRKLHMAMPFVALLESPHPSWWRRRLPEWPRMHKCHGQASTLTLKDRKAPADADSTCRMPSSNRSPLRRREGLLSVFTKASA